MIRLAPFRVEHWRRIKLQPEQENMLGFLSDYEVQQLETTDAFTAFAEDRIIAIAGVVPLSPRRGHAWALMSSEAGRHMLPITRAINRFWNINYDYHRVEMAVKCSFEEGHRWARILGFELEAPLMKRYDPQGEDYSLYARIF
jgi:hypothetical protein